MRATDFPVQRLELRERNFVAMGCDCRVVTLGGQSSLLDIAEERVRELENSWTRFRADSELQRFNDRAGEWTRVSSELMELLCKSRAGILLSGGYFNPLMGRDISRLGYNADFADLIAADPAAPTGAPNAGRPVNNRPKAAAARIGLDRASGMAWLSPGFELDSGGLGKGLGADILARELLAAGAAGTLVSLGGDVRVAGSWPDDGWRVGVHDPTSDQVVHVKVRDGSVCTSSVQKRRWVTTAGEVAHHLLNPATRASAPVGRVVGASVIARQGWRAEVLTKVALLAPLEQLQSLMRRSGEAAALLWDKSGGYQQVA